MGLNILWIIKLRVNLAGSSIATSIGSVVQVAPPIANLITRALTSRCLSLQVTGSTVPIMQRTATDPNLTSAQAAKTSTLTIDLRISCRRPSYKLYSKSLRDSRSPKWQRSTSIMRIIQVSTAISTMKFRPQAKARPGNSKWWPALLPS